MSMPVDDSESFLALMNECKVPQDQADKLLREGLSTISLFGHACPDADRSEAFIEHISCIPDGGEFQLFSAQSAALRRLHARCVSLLAEAGCQQGHVQQPVGSSAPTKPRLTVADVKSMREKFMRAYPGELLGPTVSPSISFLQILKDQLDMGNLSWIPWKSRTSESNELEYLERRRPRSDGQLLRSLLSSDAQLAEDGPENPVAMNGNPELVLSKVQQLLSNALAMLDEARLLVLKRFHNRFLEIAVQKPSDG